MEDEDYRWADDPDEVYEKVLKTHRQRILRSSLDELKSEFVKS